MVTVAAALSVFLLFADAPPSAEIGNGQIKAKIYLPDPVHGFYRSTRFDWSGVVASLEYKGHNFYGPWFYRIDPAVYDLGYDEKGVVSAPFTAMVGPAEEFGTDGAALGFAEAKPGGTFVKIGVGVLRKPQVGEPPAPPLPPGREASERYDHSRTYTLVDPGQWTVTKNRESVVFTQKLNDATDGYAYIYRKTIRLAPGKPQMMIEHSLKNTGKKAIRSTVYNHNFFVPDKEGPSKDRHDFSTVPNPDPSSADRWPDESTGKSAHVPEDATERRASHRYRSGLRQQCSGLRHSRREQQGGRGISRYRRPTPHEHCCVVDSNRECR